LFKVDALMGALRLAIQEIEKLNFSRKDSRVLRLLRRERAAPEDVAASSLKLSRRGERIVGHPENACRSATLPGDFWEIRWCEWDLSTGMASAGQVDVSAISRWPHHPPEDDLIRPGELFGRQKAGQHSFLKKRRDFLLN
jgi:hypothetical protein